MSMALQLQDEREQFYSRLKSMPIMSPNHDWMACMVASWCAGQGVLPDYLGLEPDQFKQLKYTYLYDLTLPEQAPSGSKLDFSRMLEKEDLVNLLKRYSRPNTLEMEWMIAIIAVSYTH